jgi:hypothetical protein
MTRTARTGVNAFLLRNEVFIRVWRLLKRSITFMEEDEDTGRRFLIPRGSLCLDDTCHRGDLGLCRVFSFPQQAI